MSNRDDGADLIGVLEVIYQLDQAQASWLRGILQIVASTLDRGGGVAGVLYDASNDAGVRAERIDVVGPNPQLSSVVTALHQDAAFASGMAGAYRTLLCGQASDYVWDTQASAAACALYEQAGIRDVLLINGCNVSGFGCALHVFSSTPLPLSSSERELLAHVATHLAASYRLHRRLATGRASKIEAILDTSGTLQHAAPPLQLRSIRDSLTEAVLRREWARGQDRADASRALPAWRALVRGRWTLLDHRDSDGRRYVWARENALDTSVRSPLSAREREVAALAAHGRSNKLIAYELGIAHSTVRVLLARAAAKLGARTRSQAITAFTRPWDGVAQAASSCAASAE